MPWGPLRDSEICAIHVALVPTDNGDGEIIYFGGDEHSPPELLAGRIDKSRRLNCRTEEITYVASPPADLFCCGHGFAADGRLVVGGGTETYEPESPGEHGELGHFTAERRCWIYNPRAPGFQAIASFTPEPGFDAEETGGGRWYPTIITLATGELLAVGGHPIGTDTRHENDTPERYLPAINAWKRLSQLPNAKGYDRMYVVPDGRVLVLAAGGDSVLYNPWTEARATLCPAPGAGYGGYTFSSAMLPLLPGDYSARILVAGDVSARILDLSAASPGWTDTGPRSGSAAGTQRRNSIAINLPTGQVLVVGGAQDSADDDTGVTRPELYDPQSDSWQTLDEPAAQVRNYHSSALLMPDGRVWTSGSNVDSARTQGGVERRVRNYEIFTPPYPAGTRPSISACPTRVGYNQRFRISTPQAAQIERVALMRCGSQTHAWNSDQRHVGLAIVARGSGYIDVQAPPHGAIAPPGYYMVFLIDDAGRPCQYARFVRVGGDFYAITDRSHFSQIEVEASGTPSYFYDALYVVFDGYLASELELPAGPSFVFERADTGAVVSGLSARLESTLFEAGSAADGVAQKIVLVYSLRFDSLQPFAGIADNGQRTLRVRIRSGGHETHTELVLFRRKNPYMRDGDPHWLSTDLRVLQVEQDHTFASVTQGTSASAPHDFIADVLGELRSRPEGSAHPFDQLETDQADSALELASQRGGKRVYNYAIARVRYKAPAGQHATGAKVFFRMFTTAAASMEYRNSTYPLTATDASGRPLIGLAGGEVASLPFFAAAREASLATQDDPENQRDLSGTGAESVQYFGCWLDINQDVARFRERPTDDGTGGSGALRSIQQLIRGRHQCLVAQVHFSEDPIPFGAAPGNNDNLAQRNLMIVESDNPGGGAGHRVQHTFELKPSDFWPQGQAASASGGAASKRVGLDARVLEAHFRSALATDTADTADTHDTADTPDAHDTNSHVMEAHMSHAAAPAAALAQRKRVSWDQLLIRWGDLPRASLATLYLPDVDVDELLEIASLSAGAGVLRRVDAHTIECRIGDVAMLPIPGGRATHIPGLVSIQLPDGIVAGQEFRVSFHQVSGITRAITGSFQITIPVSQGPGLLLRERRSLAVLRHIAKAIYPDNRWAPIFARYLAELADRVRALGGDPDAVAASPHGLPGADDDVEPPTDAGAPGGANEDATRGEPGRVFTGKVAQVIYDCSGDFVGFALDDCGKLRRFAAHEANVERVVARACRERARLSVIEYPAGSRRVRRIVWHG